MTADMPFELRAAARALDIPENLGGHIELVRDAADEIERLAVERDRLGGMEATMRESASIWKRACIEARAEQDRLEAERDRLREALAEAAGWLDYLIIHIAPGWPHRTQARIERDCGLVSAALGESPVPEEPTPCRTCGGSGVVEAEGMEGWCPHCPSHPTPVPDEPREPTENASPRGAQAGNGIGHPIWEDGSPILVGDPVWVDEIDGEDERGRDATASNVKGRVSTIDSKTVTIVGIWADDDGIWEAAPSDLRRRTRTPAPPILTSPHYCDDPEELAAAVRAGLWVEGDDPTAGRRRIRSHAGVLAFRRSIANGRRYWIYGTVPDYEAGA